ncbi:hypothetical protein [Dactylosporangium sp. NPDC005555]|uniref:hypothetical protein n=1 Tax=Dactylosporangium sp. NPDC005555 TaxID=3154889 RepID=UPI0033A555DC
MDPDKWESALQESVFPQAAPCARLRPCTTGPRHPWRGSALRDVARLGDPRGERQSQLDSVAAFDLSALPEGEQVRTLLSEALRHSLAADRGFVLWGQAVQDGGCDGGGRADYQADYREAQRRSRLASDAKARFLAVWNPVATRNGLRDRSSTEI